MFAGRMMDRNITSPDDGDSQVADEFRELMRGIRNASEDAARAFVRQYTPHIQRAVRRRLDRRLRPRFDSVDFVQAVWKSFFAHLPEIRSFEDPDALIAFISRVATNKVLEQMRAQAGTQKRQIHREIPLDDAGSLAAAPDPTPSEGLAAQEEWENFLQSLPVRDRSVVDLRCRGMTQDQIARELGIGERTVRRVLDRLQRKNERPADGSCSGTAGDSGR